MIEQVSAVAAAEMMTVLLRRCVYVSLHTERPDFSRPSASEAAMGGYKRAYVEWDRIEAGLALNGEQLGWTGLLPPMMVAAVGLHVSLASPDLTAYGMLDAPQHISKPGFYLPKGSVALRLS